MHAAALARRVGIYANKLKIFHINYTIQTICEIVIPNHMKELVTLKANFEPGASKYEYGNNVKRKKYKITGI